MTLNQQLVDAVNDIAQQHDDHHCQHGYQYTHDALRFLLTLVLGGKFGLLPDE